ncbi:PREDICTED: mevalonate kinase-like [Vollenhovia emeryi]|uniref:mevalonate kinase-like n=1 Tax=Vollenhovia emeryi TaxID=411798 RepID=UPI0005F4A0B8|nr:PREDICTED: mevalonate kinase-like [Vollenhovia emeryi]
MVKFRISAPGKIILFGEHAVVYGKTAVAASLNLRTTIDLVQLPKQLQDINNVIKIELPDVQLTLSVPLHSVTAYFVDGNMSAFDYPLIKINDQLHSYVKEFVDSLKSLINKSNKSKVESSVLDQQKVSLQAFFFSLVYMIKEEGLNINKTSFCVTLSTELMVSAGQGSSASFAVCLAATFLYWSRLQKGIKRKGFERDELDKISKCALECERIMHETPSGIDNTVCTYGQMVKFQKKEVTDMIKPEFNVLDFNVLLVNTNVMRSTKNQVKQVKDLKNLHPTIINPVLDSIDALSNDAWQTISKMYEKCCRDLCGNPITFSMEPDWYATLSRFVHMNQRLLNVLDVSHSQLEVVCSMARARTYAGKLTGAGGGGFAYILLPFNISNEHTKSIQDLTEELKEKGFYVTMATLSCRGVEIDYHNEVFPDN